jgi:hypothetical protein
MARGTVNPAVKRRKSLSRQAQCRLLVNEERKSGTRRSDLTSEISDLVRTHGITRDQARRLINRIGKNREKLNHAATVLKARF